MLDILKKIFVSSLLLFATVANAQETVEDAGWTAGSVDTVTGNTIYEYPNMNDDGYAVVPLQFAFPFFGQTFSMSFMWDNGLVSFYDPTANVGCNPSNTFCGGHNWNGEAGFNNTGFSYFIAPMWADMKPSPDGQTKYLTQGDSTYQRYVWKDITEYYSNGSRDSTFGLEIRADGSFDSLYESLNLISSNAVTGYVGDHSNQSEIFLVDSWKSGEMVSADNWSAMTTYDPCTDNPLSSTECAGYEQAYYAQQCDADALYDSGCPGYAEAYYEQQCNADALYDSGCPGYADALFEYNCTLDPQSDMLCPGYIDEEMFAVDETTDDFSGVDDGSDDGTGFDMYGVEETVYTSEDLYTQTIQDEAFLNFDDEDVHSEEVFINNEQPELANTEELVANDGSVNEEQVLQESIAVADETSIEEEIAVLEEMEIVDVLEEEILEEEIELDTVELIPVTEKTVATSKIDATSLVLAQTAELVSNLRAKNEENYSQASSNGQNGQEITQNEKSASKNQSGSANSSDQVAGSDEKTSNLTEDVSQTGNYMSPEAALFGSDNTGFAMLTGNASNATESVSNETESISNATENEQSVALGDSAPIGFAIIPVQQAGGVVEIVVPVEEQSLAERLAEQIRQQNLENSNDAAVGQTAALARLATAVSMEQYYGNISYTQDMYMQEQVYQNVIMQDNEQSHYNLFSKNYGTMRTLIRSQY